MSLVGRLVDTNLVILVREQTKSNFTEVVDISFVALGSYLKNNIDISELLINVVSFQDVYMVRNEATAPSTLTLMAWSLYIFTTRCFVPGTETTQLMLSV